MTEILALLGALAGVGSMVNSWLVRRSNNKNKVAIGKVESGKLDLGVAELGWDVMMDTVSTLRTEVQDCHKERDEMRTILVANGLIAK